MSHDLEVIDGQGQAIYRDPAWHALGVVVGENFGWAEAIAEGLAITLPVFKVPVRDLLTSLPLIKGVTCEALRAQDDEYAAVRSDGLVIATGLGEQWTPFHASESYEFGACIREQANAAGIRADLRSLGTLNGGRRYFMTFDLGEFTIGDYAVRDYLSVNGSYDSSWKLGVISSPTIEVCANTVALAKHTGVKHYAFKHTSGIRDRVEEAKRALAQHGANREAFQALGEKLLTVPVSPTEFKSFLHDLFPITDDVPVRTRNANDDAQDKVNALYRGGEFVASTGTGWSVVQAVNTYENWGNPIRKTGGRDERTTRALRQIDDLVSGHQTLTEKAVDLVLAK